MLTLQATILVTGGCGYIGSHVTRLLSSAGYKVIVYDDLSTGDKRSLLNGEELIVADISDTKTLKRVISENKIDSIFHFAASISVSESVRDPLPYYKNNTSNTIDLLRVSNECGVRNLIFSSTAAVYGETGGALVSEDSMMSPMSPYGRSKLMDEMIIEDSASAYGFNYAILRYFNVAGASVDNLLGQRSRSATHLIKSACSAALDDCAEFTVFGNDYDTKDGTCIRDFIHIEDLAQAHLLSLNYILENRRNLILNCGYQEGYSVQDVVEAVKSVSGIDFKVKVGPRRAGDIPALVARTEKIRDLLAWSPKYNDLRLIVKTAIEWEKKVKSET